MIKAARTGLVLAGLLGLAACDDLKGPPAKGGETQQPTEAAYSHRITGDLSGYYMPVTAVSVNGYRVKDLFLGQGADFAAWEGGSKSDTFGPVMIEFEKVGSDTGGGDVIRVLPTSYSVTDEQVRFEGVDARLGQVAFSGTLDAGALATARRNLGTEAPVLSGTLRAGGTASSGQTFSWYGGD